MAKTTCKPARKPRTRGPWPTKLVEMAAAGRTDGNLGLHDLLEEAGFSQKPAMTIIVKRPGTRTLDPYVEDVLDALRAL